MQTIDLIIIPIYFLLLVVIGYVVRSRYTNPETKAYFIPALVARIVGSIFLGLIYYGYYGGGDTVNYFENAKGVWKAFDDDFVIGIRLVFGSNTFEDAYIPYLRKIYFFRDTASYFVVRVTSFLGLFTFRTYYGTAMIFATLSFSGAWALFNVFYESMPKMKKHLAIAILFFPSLIFWGSGILKDTISFAAICWFIWGYNRFFYKRRYIIGAIALILAGYSLLIVKIYILLCLFPVLGLIAVLAYIKNIKSKVLRAFLTPFIILISLAVIALGISLVADGNEKYSAENIAKTAYITASWIQYVSETSGGAGYQLSEYFDGSVGSFIRLAPQAFVVTYFRPFIWEVKNIVSLISGLESLYVLIVFIQAIWLIITKKYALVNIPPLILFCFFFALIFGIAIGISTYNFGTLVRYKIPSLPFMMISIYFFIDLYDKKLIKKR